MTFEQLHDLIQIIFRFAHHHAYVFTIKQSMGKQKKNQYIGFDYYGEFDIDARHFFSDADELLKNWLTKEQDYAVYEIANENAFTCHIQVEKILNETDSQMYPLCIDAAGIYATTFRVLQEEDLNQENLIATINDNIEEEQFLFEDEGFDCNWERAFSTANELNKLKPWNYFQNNHEFIVEEPLTKQLLFCSVLGAANEAYGLVIYPGYYGRLSFEMLHKQKISIHDYFHSLTCLAVNFINEEDLEKMDYELIKRHGFSFKGEHNWIQFRSYEPGLFPWIPDQLDMMILQVVMEQTIDIIHHIQKGWKLPTYNTPNHYFMRKLAYSVDNAFWIDSDTDVGVFHFKEEKLELPLSEFELAKLKRYPISTMEMEYDLFYITEAVIDSSEERPTFPVLCIAIDIDSTQVLYNELHTQQKSAELAQSLLYSLLLRLEHKPTALHVTKEMAAYLRPFTKAIELTIVCHDYLQGITNLKQQMDR